MEDFSIIIPLLIILLMFIAYLSAFKDFFNALVQDLALKRFFITEYEKQAFKIHLNKFAYYKHLSHKGKKKFFKRLLFFMYSRDFIGRKGLEVTDEIKVLISASAVQLTFGLRDYKLSNTETIYIYEQPFYSKRSNLRFKGVATTKFVSLSWKDFQDGYLNPDDKINLGLHEMAHALKLTLHDGRDFDMDFASYLDRWKEIAVKKFSKMRDGKGSYLRTYAKTNMHEFFAVCVEHFFEDPVIFRKQLPDLYNYLCVLLNQDPANEQQDYIFCPAIVEKINRNPSFIPVPKKILRMYHHKGWHWLLSLMMPGIALSIPVLLILKRYTVISGEKEFLLVLGFGLLSLIQWSYFKKRKIADFNLFVLYCFFGSGPWLGILFFGVNYALPVTAPVVEQYRIETTQIDYLRTQKSGEDWEYVLDLNPAAYQEEESIRSFHAYTAPDDFWEAKKLSMTFRHGIFGFKTLRSYELDFSE